MAFCIQLGVFSSQVFQESSRHQLWRRKHCNLSSLLVYVEEIPPPPFFCLVHAVLLICFVFVFGPFCSSIAWHGEKL